MHAEVFISQSTGTPIRVGCRCGLSSDHAPLASTFRPVAERSLQKAIESDAVRVEQPQRASVS